MKPTHGTTPTGFGIWRPSEPFKTELRRQEKTCVELRCPYEECRGSFIVQWARWNHETGQLTRACPYCHRTSYLPDADKRAHARGLEVEL
jgi:hypothetical protein